MVFPSFATPLSSSGRSKSRIFLVRAQQVGSARAFNAATAPFSPCPAPARCSCSCGTGESEAQPCRIWEKTLPPSLPLRGAAGLPPESSWCQHRFALPALQGRAGRGRTEGRGSGGVITSATTPADLLGFTCQPLSQTGGQWDPSQWLGDCLQQSQDLLFQ